MTKDIRAPAERPAPEDGCGDRWRPGATAPKEHGVEIRIKIAHARGVPAYWDAELQTFVLSRPVNVESVREPLGWQPLVPSALASTGDSDYDEIEPSDEDVIAAGKAVKRYYDGCRQLGRDPGKVFVQLFHGVIAEALAMRSPPLASAGEQPDFARCLRCVSHELTRDVCGYAGRCVRQATASPAAMADHTDQARELLRKLHCWRLLYHDARPIDDPDVGLIAAALNEVASERDAAAIRAFGQRVWSDTEEVAYQAGVSDTLARLQEPDVREAAARSLADEWHSRLERWADDAAKTVNYAVPHRRPAWESERHVWLPMADAALTKI